MISTSSQLIDDMEEQEVIADRWVGGRLARRAGGAPRPIYTLHHSAALLLLLGFLSPATLKAQRL